MKKIEFLPSTNFKLRQIKGNSINNGDIWKICNLCQQWPSLLLAPGIKKPSYASAYWLSSPVSSHMQFHVTSILISNPPYPLQKIIHIRLTHHNLCPQGHGEQSNNHLAALQLLNFQVYEDKTRQFGISNN
jgi:hypothetical protein